MSFSKSTWPPCSGNKTNECACGPGPPGGFGNFGLLGSVAIMNWIGIINGLLVADAELKMMLPLYIPGCRFPGNTVTSMLVGVVDEGVTLSHAIEPLTEGVAVNVIGAPELVITNCCGAIGPI